MRREYRERSPDQIEAAKATRHERTLARQELRRIEVGARVAEGDLAGAAALQRTIDLAQRAIDARSSTADKDDRKARLKELAETREKALEADAMMRFRRHLLECQTGKTRFYGPEDNILPRPLGPVALGPRESAKLVLASPRIDTAIAFTDEVFDEDFSGDSVSMGAMYQAAVAATAGDRRRRVIRHVVLVPPVGEPEERSIDRVKTVLAACKVDQAADFWVAIEHDGSGGSGQGRHLHVLWVTPDVQKHGGHACMAFAARMWAELNDNPTAAQGISLATNSAAHRDWERVADRSFSDVPARIVVETVTAYHDPQFAGGLWLQKPGWRADQFPDPAPFAASGNERCGGAGPHCWGWD